MCSTKGLARAVNQDLTVCRSACLSVCLSVCLLVCVSACRSVCVSVCLSACLSSCLSVCRPACLSVCLPPLSVYFIIICRYCVIYLVHALYFRQGFYHMGGLGPKASSISGKPYQKVVMELLQGLLLLWLCVVLCIAWWIGVSRFVDHRHNIDDILVRVAVYINISYSSIYLYIYHLVIYFIYFIVYFYLQFLLHLPPPFSTECVNYISQ